MRKVRQLPQAPQLLSAEPRSDSGCLAPETMSFPVLYCLCSCCAVFKDMITSSLAMKQKRIQGAVWVCIPVESIGRD